MSAEVNFSKGAASFEDAERRLIRLLAVRSLAALLTARGLSELVPTMVRTAYQWWRSRTAMGDQGSFLLFVVKVMYVCVCVLVPTGYIQPELLLVAALVPKLVSYILTAIGIYRVARDVQRDLSHNPRKLIECLMILVLGLGVLNGILRWDFTVMVIASSIAIFLLPEDNFLLQRNASFPGEHILLLGFFLQAVSLDMERGVL